LKPPQPTRRPAPEATTIRDVARRAGVSVATVSRALNGHSNVLDETRRRVLAAAAELRFVPSGAARSLNTGRTHTVGALLPDLHDEYFSELIRGIDRAARQRGLHLLLSSSHGDAGEAVAALHAMKGRVDGLVVMWPHGDAEFLHTDLPAGVPAVLVNTRLAGAQQPQFDVDNRGGAAAMVRHLAGVGHRHIAFIAGPPANFEAGERLRGYREALAEVLPGTPEQVLEGDFTEDAGRRAGTLLASRPQRPDAVFAANDMMALGCLAALAEHGLRVPDDLALAGFDDIPIARYVSPGLTTIKVPIVELGALAVERLFAPDGAARSQTLPAQLVVRQSSGARRRNP
jgi:LacI family transcriptional regulator